MRNIFALLAFVAFSTAAQAQECRKCLLLPTVAACVPCSVAGGYPQATSEKWCRKNHPPCAAARKALRN